MSSLTAGYVALAAAALALLSLALATVLALRLRRLRAAQRLVLGEYGERDLVAHSQALDAEFRALHAYVGETAAALGSRMDSVESWLGRTITYRGVVRYDAFDEMSGRQSCSIALLDASVSGLVLTHLMRRDQARLYVRRIVAGRGEHELAPEEQEAIRLALASEGQAQ